MFTNNKFARMDSIAELVKTILETDTKAKMEELKGGQHKIDKNKNNKIDAQDFAILRGEKKAMKKEETEQIDEVYDTEHMKYINTKEGDKHFEDGHSTMMKHIGDEFQKVNAKRYASQAFKQNPHKKGTKEYKAWHHGADAASDEHISSLHEAAKWRSTSVAKKITDPDDPQDSVSYDYHHDNPRSTGMKKATSDTPEKYGSLSARPNAQVASQGSRKGMITKQHGERLKARIKYALNQEETEQVDEAKEPGFKASYGIGRKGTVAKKPETYGKRVQGKGYDNPENERKAPEGKVPMTSLMPGYSDKAARLAAVQAKGRLVKGSAQSAKQVEKEEIDPSKTVTDTLKGREMADKNPFLSKKVMMDVPGNVKEESEQIDELKKSRWADWDAGIGNPKLPGQTAKAQSMRVPVLPGQTTKAQLDRNIARDKLTHADTGKGRMQASIKKYGDSIKKEEVEQVNEKAKWRNSSAAEPNPEHDPEEYAHDKLSTGSPIRSKADKPLPYGSIQSRRGTEIASSGPRKGMVTKKSAERLKNRIKANLNKEEVDERTLTAPEKAEKERIVKGMKKSLAGFKSRYGERAKSVMYATATKAAKERK